MFYFRETNQGETKKRIGYPNNKEKSILNKFALAQLDILKEIIIGINPKVIVVVNAFASDIINDYGLFKINKNEFEMEGYDILEIDNKNIPIIFSSMLTGQRALDNHSLRRLKWIIKKSITIS